MRKILSIMAVALTVVLAGCSKDSENNSFVTLLPTVELKGEPVVTLSVGDSYTDAGADVAINGEPRTDFVVDGSVNTSEPGLYPITYSMMNVDGYSASATRLVYVSDPTFQTQWFVPVSIARDGKLFYTDVMLMFEKLDDTHIYCEDLMGGFYCYARGIGPDAAAEAIITISDPDSDGWAEIEEYQGGDVVYWGDAIDGISGKINVKTGILHWHTSYAGMDFEPYND